MKKVLALAFLAVSMIASTAFGCWGGCGYYGYDYGYYPYSYGCWGC